MDANTLEVAATARTTGDGERVVRREVPVTQAPTPDQAETPTRAPADGRTDGRTNGRTWPWLLLTVAVCATLFALLHNPYWSPGGDSEVYTAVARSIVQGNGYQFNGAPYALSPPGWPVVLAGFMQISPTFAFLKAMQIAMMVGALGLFFQIGTRLAPPPMVALAVCLAALLHPLYQLTFLLHSEPLFMLLSTGAILAALRVGEGRSRWGGVAVAVLLALATVMTRDAGLFHWVLIAGAFATGLAKAGRSALLPALVGTLLCGVVMAGTFKANRTFLALSAEDKQAAIDTGGIEAQPNKRTNRRVAPPVPDTVGIGEALASSDVDTPFANEMLARAGRTSQWFAQLLWHPTRVPTNATAAVVVVQVVGWLSAALVLVTAAVGAWRGQWVWVGLALYCVAFVFVWPQVNNRYFVPAAPLIILAVLLALRSLRPRGIAWPGVALGLLFVATVLGTNGLLYACDLRIARSGSAYYDRFEGGDHKGLIAAARHLREAGIEDGDVVVTTKYSNLGRSKDSPYGVRAAVLLLDADVVPIDKDATSSGTTTRMRKLVRASGARWYLYQEPHAPWRVWHFRLTPEFQKRFTGEPVTEASGGWILYEDTGTDRLTGVTPPDPGMWPTRVPGL